MEVEAPRPRWHLQEGERWAFLFWFGVVGAAGQALIFPLLGRETNLAALGFFAVCAFGAPAAIGLIGAWKGRARGDDNAS